jgi:hypothetical protein
MSVIYHEVSGNSVYIMYALQDRQPQSQERIYGLRYLAATSQFQGSNRRPREQLTRVLSACPKWVSHDTKTLII